MEGVRVYFEERANKNLHVSDKREITMMTSSFLSEQL